MLAEHKISNKSGIRLYATIFVLTIIYIVVYEVVSSTVLFVESIRRASVSSQPVPEDQVQRVAEASVAREAGLTPKHRAAAWQLGIRLGYMSFWQELTRLADIASQEEIRTALAPMQTEAKGFADFLQLEVSVEPLKSPTLEDLTLLTRRIESDESGLAARIEQRVSVRHRHLFLCAMHVGVEMAALDQATGFRQNPAEAEIRQHAALADLPQSLWEPLAKPPESVTPNEGKASYRAAVARASDFIYAGNQ